MSQSPKNHTKQRRQQKHTICSSHDPCSVWSARGKSKFPKRRIGMIPSTVGVKCYLTPTTVDNDVKLTLKHNIEVPSFFTLQVMLQTVRNENECNVTQMCPCSSPHHGGNTTFDHGLHVKQCTAVSYMLKLTGLGLCKPV